MVTNKRITAVTIVSNYIHEVKLSKHKRYLYCIKRHYDKIWSRQAETEYF